MATEQFRSQPYNDPPGSPTYSTGFGHQVKPNEGYLMTTVLTKAQAIALFKADVAPLEKQISYNLKHALNQSQFDALVDFGFNCGSGALANVLVTWNATGDMNATAARMKLYNKVRKNGVLVVSDDLTERRLQEALAFVSENKTSIAVFAAIGVGAWLLFS